MARCFLMASQGSARLSKRALGHCACTVSVACGKLSLMPENRRVLASRVLKLPAFKVSSHEKKQEMIFLVQHLIHASDRRLLNG